MKGESYRYIPRQNPSVYTYAKNMSFNFGDTPQERYDRYNTKGFYLKLNIKTDADIIKALSTKKSKQGYIKQLIREDLARSDKNKTAGTSSGNNV